MGGCTEGNSGQGWRPVGREYLVPAGMGTRGQSKGVKEPPSWIIH